MSNYISKAIVKPYPAPGTILLEDLVDPVIEQYLIDNPASGDATTLQAVTDEGNETSNPLIVTFGGDPAVQIKANNTGEGLLVIKDSLSGNEGALKIAANSLTQNREYTLPDENGVIQIGVPNIDEVLTSGGQTSGGLNFDNGSKKVVVEPTGIIFGDLIGEGSVTLEIPSPYTEARSILLPESTGVNPGTLVLNMDNIPFAVDNSGFGGVVVLDPRGTENHGFLGPHIALFDLNTENYLSFGINPGSIGGVRKITFPSKNGEVAVIDGSSAITEVAAIGSDDNNLVLSLNGGTDEIFKFTSNSTSLGEFIHNNTAARSYVLPDKDGTVAVIDGANEIGPLASVASPGPRFNINFPDGPYGGYIFEGSTDTSGISKFISTATAGQKVFNLPDISGTIALAEKTPRVLADFYTDVTNATTAAEVLYTYAMPASTLRANGDKIKIEFGGSYNDSTAGTNIAVHVGNKKILQTGSLTIDASGTWRVEVTVIRISDTAIRTSGTIVNNGAANNIQTSTAEHTAIDGFDGNSNDIAVKVTTPTAGDVTAKFGTITYYPAV